jgi:hypothetical protein
MTDAVEAAIFDLLAKLPAGKSVSPEEVARAVDAEGWRRCCRGSARLRWNWRGLGGW